MYYEFMTNNHEQCIQLLKFKANFQKKSGQLGTALLCVIVEWVSDLCNVCIKFELNDKSYQNVSG